MAQPRWRYGKSRSVLKVKVSRHQLRYYRVPQDELSNEGNQNHKIQHEIRIEPIELAMRRLNQFPFVEISFDDFCEPYEISTDGPKDGLRLQQWNLQNSRVYIKAMAQKQAIRPTSRYRSDELDHDYCYSQLFL